MSYLLRRLVPGHMVQVKNRKTGEVIKNKWELRIEVGKDPVSGKRKTKTFRFEGGKKQADNELQRLRIQFSDQGYVEPTQITLGKHIYDWLQFLKSEGELAPRTLDGYIQIFENHLKPALGNIPIGQLRPYHIASYKEKKLSDGGRLDNKKGGISTNTLKKHLVVLNMALEDASSDEKQLIPFNPMTVSKKKKKNRRNNVWKAAKNFLMAEALSELLESIKNSCLYPLAFTAAYTGMRLSELLALTWDNICLKSKQITIFRTSHYGKDGHHYNYRTKEGSPKTIAFGDKLLTFFKKLKKELISINGNANNLVFAGPDGEPYNNYTISSTFRNLVKRRGYTITFHGLRHSHASILINAGVPIPVVCERLGHSSPVVTFKEYAHAIPSMQEGAANLFDKVMDSNNEQLNYEMHKQHKAAEVFEHTIQ